MTQSTSFERALAAMLVEEAGNGPAEHVVDDLFTATRRTRQTPAWLARLQEPQMRWHHGRAAGTSRGRLVLVLAGLLLILAAVAAVIGSRLAAPSTGNGDWPGYRGGPSRDGVGVVGPVGGPVLHWAVDAGAAVKDAVAIMGDVAIFPSQDGVLHAVAVGDGRERWTFAPGTSITGPTGVGELVLVADGRGVVHALTVGNGTERWRSTAVFASVSGLAAGDGAVYLATGDGQVAALDAGTGALRWQVEVGSKAVHVPAFADGSVFVATDDGTLIRLRGSDGRTLWSAATGPDPTGTPTIASGIVYLGASSDQLTGRLQALDAATGALLWSVDDVLFAPSVSGSIAVSASVTGGLSARDARTGTELWATSVTGSTRGPAVVDGVVYAADDLDRTVDALDLATGQRRWSFPVSASNQCCVAVAKGYVFVGMMDGSVVAIGGDGSGVLPAASPTQIAPAATPAPTPLPATAAPTATPAPTASLARDPFTVLARHTAADLGLEGPLSLAIGPTGDIYVTEQADRVTQIGPDGTVIRRWGTHGASAGQFDFTPAAAGENVHASIGVGPDGKIYISDSDNHRIQVFTPDGRFVRAMGELGSGPGQFTIPFDVSADAAGNVYAIDDGLMRLTKFTPEGDVAWIVDGSTDPRLNGHAHDADLDPDGRIVLLIDDLGTVVILDPDGTIADDFSAAGCDVTLDPAGRHYVTSCFGGIDVYDHGHNLIAKQTGLEIGAPQFGPDGQVVALGNDGSLVFLSVRLPAS